MLIGDEAFADCANLKLTLPEGIGMVGKDVLQGTLPDRLEQEAAARAEQERIAEFMSLVVSGLSYDVIKIPHHGGYDKTLGNLLRENKGLRYCMVHVRSEALAEASLVTAIRSSGAPAKYTCNGDISFATDGVSMTVHQP